MKKWTNTLLIGFWIFVIGSIFGFVFEGIIEIIRHGSWVNRQGLLYGPISQVYGIGFVILCITLYKVKKTIYLFLIGTIVGGLIEYILSLLQEYVFGTISWDYCNSFLNINGRTSLFHAFMWGIITFLAMKFLYPIILKFCKKLQNKIGYTITIILFVLLVVDIFLSISASIRQDQRKHHIPPHSEFEHFIDKHYPDEKMDKIYNNKMYRYEK